MTDSNSGIFPDEAKSLGIWSIGMPVLLNGEAKIEGADLSHGQFFDAISHGATATTSQPSPGSVCSMWDEILGSGYDEVVYIPMSSGLSHSCESAKMLAAQYGGKVSVADNRRVSVTQRASVIEAKRMADDGMPAAHIRAQLELNRDQSSIYLIVDTLDYLVRGGRVTPAAAALASVLKIKPILTIQGEMIEPYAKERGMRKALPKMFAAAKHDAKKKLGAKGFEDLSVGIAGAGLFPEKEQEYLDAAREDFPGADVFYDKLPLSVAVHTGPGAIGIGIHKKGEGRIKVSQ